MQAFPHYHHYYNDSFKENRHPIMANLALDIPRVRQYMAERDLAAHMGVACSAANGILVPAELRGFSRSLSVYCRHSLHVLTVTLEKNISEPAP
jgi:hypothetical protein